MHMRLDAKAEPLSLIASVRTHFQQAIVTLSSLSLSIVTTIKLFDRVEAPIQADLGSMWLCVAVCLKAVNLDSCGPTVANSRTIDA